jgi:osmotically-inducible protein OsmY
VYVPRPDQPVDEVGAELAAQTPDGPPTITLMTGDHVTHNDLLSLQAQSPSFVARWPQAEAVVLQLLVEHVTGGEVVEVPTPEDADIARELRESIDIPGLDVIVVNRNVVLLGTVRSLWEVWRLQRRILEFSFIDSVTTSSVVVEAPDVPDALLEHAIRGFLRAASNIDDETVAVVVRDRRVTLAGVAADAQEHNDLIGAVTHVRGVRAVEDLTTTSSEGKRQSLEAARTIRAHIQQRFPEQDINVAVFDGTALLEGNVDSERLKTAVEREARKALDEYVVMNNLDVAGEAEPCYPPAPQRVWTTGRAG